MQKDQRPAHVCVCGEDVFEPVKLWFGQTSRLWRFGVEANEQNVAVHERVIRWAESRLPHVGHHLVADIVIARKIKEGHLQGLDEAGELVPLPVENFAILRVAFDEIADTHDKLRLQEVELTDGIREHAWSMAAGSVGDDGELEGFRVVCKIQMRPGIHFPNNDPRLVITRSRGFGRKQE